MGWLTLGRLAPLGLLAHQEPVSVLKAISM